MTLSWMARRWCVVEQDEQQDLFISDPWHMHLVDINMRLDVPRERTLCGDLLPSRPVYQELTRPILKNLCPECANLAGAMRGGRPATAPRQAQVQEQGEQIEMYTASRSRS